MMQKIVIGCLALCSLLNCLQAEMVYAAITGLPMSFQGLPPHLRQSQPPSFNVARPQRSTFYGPPSEVDSPQRSVYGPPTQLDSPQRSQYGPSSQLDRQQRSLYGPIHGGGWHQPVHHHSIGLGHISKEELVTLLQAAKEAAAEPEPEPEPEEEPEPEPEEEAPEEPAAEAAPAVAPAGVPLTVSLPAFVPIQLSAMYTAPAPPAAPEAAPAPEAEPEEEAEEEPEEEEEPEPEPEEEPEPEVGPVKPYPFHPAYHGPWSSRGVYSSRNVVPFIPRAAKATRTRSKAARKPKSRSKSKAKPKSRSRTRSSRKNIKARKSNLRYAGSTQSIQVLPPPPFLSRPPAPLRLVPSNQLLSNWN